MINEKAKTLLPNTHLYKKTEFHIHFMVDSNERHYIIFDKLKNEWRCDCKWWTLKNSECSHILASKLKLVELDKDG